MPDLVAVLINVQCAATHVVVNLLMASEESAKTDLTELSMLEFEQFDPESSSIALRFVPAADGFGRAIQQQAADVAVLQFGGANSGRPPLPVPPERMPEFISLDEILRGKQPKTLEELIPFGAGADFWASDEDFDAWMHEWRRSRDL